MASRLRRVLDDLSIDKHLDSFSSTGGMTREKLNGYITGVVCSPTPFNIEDHLQLIIGDEFDTLDDRNREIFTGVMNRYFQDIQQNIRYKRFIPEINYSYKPIGHDFSEYFFIYLVENKSFWNMIKTVDEKTKKYLKYIYCLYLDGIQYKSKKTITPLTLKQRYYLVDILPVIIPAIYYAVNEFDELDELDCNMTLLIKGIEALEAASTSYSFTNQSQIEETLP